MLRINEKIKGDTFGEYFLNAITSKNLTLGEIARVTSIPSNHLYDIRDNKKTLSVNNALKIQEHFQINARNLLHKQTDYKLLEAESNQKFNETSYQINYDDMSIIVEIVPNDGFYSSANHKVDKYSNPDKVIRHQLGDLHLCNEELLEYAKATVLIRFFISQKLDATSPKKIAIAVRKEYQTLLKLREKAPSDFKVRMQNLLNSFIIFK